MNKLGMHIERLTGTIADYIEQYKPAGVVWVGPNPEGIDAIRERSPGTAIVIRKHEGGRDWQTNAGPHAWADEAMAMVTDGHGHVHKPDGVIAWNEPFGHDHLGLFTPFDDWQVAFLERLREKYGVEAVLMNFGTGNFNRGAPNLIRVGFPGSCEKGHLFGIHEYYWPSMFDDRAVGWHTVRWPYWKQAIGREGIRFIVTECGLTQAVHEGRPDVGYRTYDDGVTDDTYVDSLSWYNAQLVQDEAVDFAAVFDWGNWSWPTFEHEDKPELVRRFFAISSPVPPEQPPGEPPEEPNGGEEPVDEDKIKVVDLDYNERDFEYARSKYGVAFRRAKVEPGQKVYRLIELWEKTGHTSLITQVLNEDGSPMANIDMAFYWPDAPDPPDPPTEVYPHDWHRRFVHGLTNPNGEVGPGMGTGAYHGEGEGGPHAVWVRDPNIPTDICEKLGMLAGTNHHHFDQKFKLMVEGEEPGPGEPGADRLEEVEEVEQDHPVSQLAIAYPKNGQHYDTRGIGLGPGVDEEVHPEDWIHPVTDEPMAMVAVTTDFDGDEPRLFSIVVIRLPGRQEICNPVSLEFQPKGMAPRKRHVFVHKWATEPPDTPGPGPDPERDQAMAELLRKLRDTAYEQADLFEQMAELLAPTSGMELLRDLLRSLEGMKEGWEARMIGGDDPQTKP